MAKVTSKATVVEFEFVLVLNEAEAQYVHAALLKSNPVHLPDGDVVYSALADSMRGAGVEFDLGAA